MNTHRQHALIHAAQTGGQAYVRNLAEAEAAILRGQFNLAKVLRACAHAQRVLALNDARRLAGEVGATDLLRAILSELATTAPPSDPALPPHSVRVRQGLTDILERSLASLESNPDILESDVAQFLWGCYNCGHIVEGDRPDACPACGALGVEFEWFGPFYARTPEHLGQLAPAEMAAVLEAIPAQVAEAIAQADDATLLRKPTPQEWCVKEIIGHMIETDLLFTRRAQAVLEASGVPPIPRSAPPWKLHEGKGYEALPAGELLARLAQARAASLALVRSLAPEQWMRQGLLLGAPTSLLDLGTWLANHDRGHLAQIRQLCGGRG